MTIPRTPFCCTIVFAFCLAGCASHVPEPAPQIVWDLSPNAEASFSYLKFQELKQQGQSLQAIEALKDALKIAPTPYLYLELADMQWQSKEIDNTRTTLKQGIAAFPDSPNLFISLAKTYEATGRWEDASVTLQDYLHTHPKSWDMVRELAALHIKQKQFAKALDRLQTIPEESRDVTTFYLLGKAASGVGIYAKAIAFYQKALEKDPHFFRAKAELAYLYETQKKYVEAMKIYEEMATQGEPGSPLLLTMIRLNLKLNAADKAFALAKELPEDLGFQVDAAGLFLDQQFYSYAASILEPLVNEPKLPPQGWFSLALLAYDGQHNLQKAEEYLAKIPKGNPYFERALLFRVDVLYRLKKYQPALDLAQEGADFFPNQPRFILLQGSLLKEMGEWSKSVTILEAALQKWSKNIDILFSLGVLWDEHDNKDKGMEYMEKIISIDPDYPEALNYLGYSLAVQEKNLDRAELLIQTAIKAEPENGYYLDSLAWVFFKQGQLENAWQEINKAVTFAGTDPTIWEHYALIAEALGKNNDAAKGRANAQKFGENNATDN